MPSEDTPVIKRNSIEAAQFWNQYSGSVTASFKPKPQTSVFTVQEITSFQLPFQRQSRPFEMERSFFSSPPTTFPTFKKPEVIRTSRSVEREVLQKALMSQETQQEIFNNHSKQRIEDLVWKHTQALKINIALAVYQAKLLE